MDYVCDLLSLWNGYLLITYAIRHDGASKASETLPIEYYTSQFNPVDREEMIFLFMKVMPCLAGPTLADRWATGV